MNCGEEKTSEIAGGTDTGQRKPIAGIAIGEPTGNPAWFGEFITSGHWVFFALLAAAWYIIRRYGKRMKHFKL